MAYINLSNPKDVGTTRTQCSTEEGVQRAFFHVWQILSLLKPKMDDHYSGKVSLISDFIYNNVCHFRASQGLPALRPNNIS